MNTAEIRRYYEQFRVQTGGDPMALRTLRGFLGIPTPPSLDQLASAELRAQGLTQALAVVTEERNVAMLQLAGLENVAADMMLDVYQDGVTTLGCLAPIPGTNLLGITGLPVLAGVSAKGGQSKFDHTGGSGLSYHIEYAKTVPGNIASTAYSGVAGYTVNSGSGGPCETRSGRVGWLGISIDGPRFYPEHVLVLTCDFDSPSTHKLTDIAAVLPLAGFSPIRSNVWVGRVGDCMAKTTETGTGKWVAYWPVRAATQFSIRSLVVHALSTAAYETPPSQATIATLGVGYTAPDDPPPIEGGG